MRIFADMTRLYKNTSLFIITGWFYDAPTDDTYGNFPFGGHFDLDHENRLEGRLSDDCGSSRITGTMTSSVLEFRKKYPDQKSAYYYKFEKKSGLWVGGWADEPIQTTYLDHNTSQQARCLTMSIWDAYRAMNKRRLDSR